MISHTPENYSFKHAMQQNIKESLQPILYYNNFRKYKANKYIREINSIAQFITFSIETDRLKSYAMYFPVFLPFDDVLDYGIEITGSTGIDLLNGKYYTAIYEKEKFDKVIQLRNYEEQHKKRFENIVLSIKEGIIPEMETINSFECFINKVQGKEVIFFGHKFRNEFKSHPIHKFIIMVYKCLNGQFEQAKKELELFKENIIEDEIKACIEKLLLPEIGGSTLTKEKFIRNYEEICNERRKKYKLLK